MRNDCEAWSDEEIETLKSGLAAGLSSGGIVRRLQGRRTRNAIVGKIHRLGLSSSVKTSRERKAAESGHRRRSRVRASERRVIVPLPKRDGKKDLPVLQCDPPLSERVKLVDLQHHHCRWLIGEGADASFCGREKHRGSYCEAHAERALIAPHRIKRRGTPFIFSR